jgi:uncharacterized protein YaiL (DUF2058 family)
MRNALHEQLLKAGLINEERLEQAEREKRQVRQDNTRTPGGPRQGGKGRGRQDGQPQRRGGEAPQRQAARPVVAQADKRAAPTAARAGGESNQGGHARAVKASARAEAEAARRALEREVVALIKANRHQHNDGDEVFNFIDGRKIGRIYCTADTQRRLTSGELAIVRLRTRYAVVPTATAAGIAAKAPDLVLLAHQGGEQVDDPAYAEHPVPDDLRW